MSEYDWEDDDTTEDAPRESNALREARNAYKAMKKQNKELAEQLASFQKSQREQSVRDVLNAKGLNAKIARLVPDSATSVEDVEAWLDENADLFGVPAAPDGEANVPAPNPALDALDRISTVQQTGTQFTGDADQMMALIQNASDPEALNELLFGSRTGPQAI